MNVDKATKTLRTHALCEITYDTQQVLEIANLVYKTSQLLVSIYDTFL